MKNSTQIILTGKEVELLHDFYRKNVRHKIFGGTITNVVIKESDCNSIGKCLFVQTQDDFINGKDNWEDITDYESW